MKKTCGPALFNTKAQSYLAENFISGYLLCTVFSSKNVIVKQKYFSEGRDQGNYLKMTLTRYVGADHPLM